MYCILTFLPDTDDVKLGAATIKAKSIGVAIRSNGFQDVDGILGIGPVDLSILFHPTEQQLFRPSQTYVSQSCRRRWCLM